MNCSRENADFRPKNIEVACTMEFTLFSILAFTSWLLYQIVFLSGILSGILTVFYAFNQLQTSFVCKNHTFIKAESGEISKFSFPSLNCHFWGKFTKMIVRSFSWFLTNSPWFWKIFTDIIGTAILRKIAKIINSVDS